MKHQHLTDELQERASLYAAGAMPESERIEYRRHIEEDDCAVCRQEVQELQAVVTSLAFGVPAQGPSPAVKLRLMEQTYQAAALRPPKPGLRHYRWIAWATGLTTIAAAALLVAVLNENSVLRRLNDTLNREIARLEAGLQDQETRIATLTSPQVRVVDLAGQGSTPGARGRIFWDQTTRRWFFYVHDLPPVAVTLSYQLWFIPTVGNPVSAAVFNTAPDGTAVADITVPENLSALRAAAVTTEPAGGLPQPSGPFALLGAFE